MPSVRILAVFLAILTLSTACGGPKTTPAETAGSTEEVPAQTPVPISDESPVATTDAQTPEPTTESESSPESTPGPTPIPTPSTVSLTCPEDRDNAGLEYEHDPGEMSESEAVEAHCGTLAPVTEVCPHYMSHYGKSVQYDPDDIDSLDDLCGGHCGIEGCGESGPYAPGFICPEEYEDAGFYYDYDKDEMTLEEAEAAFCGPKKCIVMDDNAIQRILKGVRSEVGNCYFMAARIYQFDVNTGPCSFLASFSQYENYPTMDERISTFGYDDDPLFHPFVEDCPELDNVFEHDEIVISARYLGVETYETRGGGTNTVPAFKIESVRQ